MKSLCLVIKLAAFVGFSLGCAEEIAMAQLTSSVRGFEITLHRAITIPLQPAQSKLLELDSDSAINAGAHPRH